MSKEEIEKEAEESSKKAFCVAHTHEDKLIFKNGYLAAAESREKKIEELDKQIDTMLEDCKRCTYRKTSEQLEQATEIIKNCIHILKHSGTALDWKTVINQAEQFLKEAEK